MKNTLTKIILVASILLPVLGCNKHSEEKDIVILYTSDVHCGIDNNIGYASLAAYKKNLENDNYVTLMDSGDAISGDFIGAVSKGEYIIDMMNEVGYDSMIFGNHEFDYGMDVLSQRINEFNGDVLSCNFKYIGQKQNKFTQVKPYKIISYGSTKVGFVGVTTPYTIVDSTPSYFMEDGEYAYSFSNAITEGFYSCIQDSINACYENNANYVVLLTHLGVGDEYLPFSSIDVINNTKNVTAVLDGHAHKLISNKIKDQEGKDVPLLQPGYQMSGLGQLTIKKDQTIETKLIESLEMKDDHIASFIDIINAKVEEKASEVMAHSDLALDIVGPEGTRMVRNREMPIGNLVSDAYRILSDAEIGIANGGGIRSSLKAGDITFSDIKAIHPFGNTIDVILASGQQIADYLEFASSKTEAEYYQEDTEGKKSPKGESGAFAQVSGLKYTIDTSIHSTVKVDDKGMFVSVDGTRRAKDILVLEDGNYVPLDLTKSYLVASHNYLIEEGGDGANMFKSAPLVKQDLMLDYEILVRYIVDVLNGQLKDKYSSVEGRITII
ncbi:MAG: bifunctional metallophosphatase/5'-nucleotidase [Bacilli bacterium]|nr:bifunctional metallophosphatase/5'-nucleotidase [Bacilli bacterium]